MDDTILTSITIYGMAVVISFIVAALIRGIVIALPMLRRPEAAPSQQPTAASVAGVPPEHVAAITAAVAAMVGTRHIVHIEDRARDTAWAHEGRMIHQTSHAVGHAPKH